MQRLREHGFLELVRRFWKQLRTHGLLMTGWAALDTILRNLTGSPVRQFSEITPRIFVGGQPADTFWGKLTEWGVGGVVNMRGEYDYSARVDPLDLPLEFLHLPTVDNNAPTLEHLEQGVDFIRQHVQQDEGVYIHCWEGLGRGPTMAAAYLVSTGISVDEAWDKIKESRPFIRPTEPQIEQLKTFALDYQPNKAPDPVKF